MEILNQLIIPILSIVIGAIILDCINKKYDSSPLVGLLLFGFLIIIILQFLTLGTKELVPLLLEEEAPVKVVREYYEDLSKGDTDAAIRKWHSSSLEKKWLNDIKNIKWSPAEEVQSITFNGKTSKVFVKVKGKQKEENLERWVGYWVGYIELKKNGDGKWEIFNLTIGKVARDGLVPLPPDKDAPVEIVLEYYENLKRRNTEGAISKWHISSQKQVDNLSEIIENGEWYEVHKAYSITSDGNTSGNTSKVFVDVRSKQKGKNPARWKGYIELEKKWKISNMQDLRKTHLNGR